MGAAGARKGSSDAQKKRKNRRVERAKQLIRDYGDGERLANRETSSRTLYLSEYRQLLEEIGDDDTLKNIIVTNKGLRYDYTADNKGKNNRRSKQFVVRMPTSFHERLADEIDEAIKHWRDAIIEGRARCGPGMCSGQYCTNHNTTEVAKKLKGQRSESVSNSELAESDKKDPDLSYALEERPGLVVEIGWAQKSSDLQKKCKWYIENSKGEVRTVIGVDLSDLYRCYPISKTQPRGPGKHEHNKARKEDIAKMVHTTKKNGALGKIFLWRAKINDSTNQVTAVLHENKPQIFRDENGKAACEVACRLSLEDFISPRALEKIGILRNPELAIMSEPLCTRFEAALRAQIRKDRAREQKNTREKGSEKDL
ncbi:hypothetical protein F5Y08DRAFT_350406 [Xylaria arbuscula]|nr:hypothetical protein F5Y08DRAFT_350406 [Xylaria arbuscula]